jgi:hypothetical protein
MQKSVYVCLVHRLNCLTGSRGHRTPDGRKTTLKATAASHTCVQARRSESNSGYSYGSSRHGQHSCTDAATAPQPGCLIVPRAVPLLTTKCCSATANFLFFELVVLLVPRLQRAPRMSKQDAAAAAATAAAMLTSLAAATVEETDGAEKQCFYIATTRALGIPCVPNADGWLCWPDLRKLLRETVLSITSACLLASFGLEIDASADAAAVKRCQQAYLADGNFQRQQWGGTVEMYLLSHAEGGRLRFAFYNSLKSEWTNIPALASSSSAFVEREIVLHCSAYQGGETENHWEPVLFRLHGSSEPLRVWPCNRAESAAERDRRIGLVVQACDAERDHAVAVNIDAEQRHLVAAMELPDIDSPPPTRAGARKRTAASLPAANQPIANKRSKPAAAAAAAAAAENTDASAASISWQVLVQQGNAVVHPALLQCDLDSPHSPLCLPGGDACVEVRIQAEQSRIRLDQPVQFGLYATAAHSVGQLVTPYGGLLRDVSDFDPNDKGAMSYGRRLPNSSFVLDGLPLACMFSRPVPRTEQGLQVALQEGMQPLLPSGDPFSPQQLELFGRSAFGFMANTAAPSQWNVKVAYQSVRVGDMSQQTPVLVASRAIAEGEEIFCPYNSNEGKRLLSEELEAAAATPSPESFAAIALVVRRNLLAGSSSQLESLQMQRNNLDVFLQKHAADFAKLRYQPWTQDSPASKQLDAAVQVRPSNLVASLAGVYFRAARKSSSR